MKNNTKNVRAEFQEKLSTYLTAAFGLVAGLAWNDAISSLIKYWYPAEQGHNITAKFVYAVAVTLLVVLFTVYILRLLKERAGTEPVSVPRESIELGE